MIDGLRILPTIVFLSLFPWRTCRRIKATWDAKLHVCTSFLPGKRRFLSLHATDIRHRQQSTSKVDEVHIIPRFWVTTPAAVHAKIGLKWMTNILQLAIKGNELTNQTKRYLVDDTWQLFSTKNWWALGLLSVPRNLGQFPDRMELGMLVLEARENRRSRGTISHSRDWRTISKTWTRTRQPESF